MKAMDASVSACMDARVPTSTMMKAMDGSDDDANAWLMNSVVIPLMAVTKANAWLMNSVDDGNDGNDRRDRMMMSDVNLFLTRQKIFFYRVVDIAKMRSISGRAGFDLGENACVSELKNNYLPSHRTPTLPLR